MKRIVLPIREDGPSEAGGSDEKAQELRGQPPMIENERIETRPAPRRTVAVSDRQDTPPRQRHLIPPALVDILTESTKVGTAFGVMGTVVGYGFGLYRPGHPKLFAVLSGTQWAALSSTFWGYRLLAMHYLEYGVDATRRQRVKASAIAGGLAGMSVGLLRSPQNALYGSIAWSLYGAGGQATIDWWHSRPKKQESNGSFWDGKYSPLKRLSDHDYAKILEKRLLHVEATIAVVDDNIQAVQEDKRRHQATVLKPQPAQLESEKMALQNDSASQ